MEQCVCCFRPTYALLDGFHELCNQESILFRITIKKGLLWGPSGVARVKRWGKLRSEGDSLSSMGPGFQNGTWLNCLMSLRIPDLKQRNEEWGY